MKIKPEFAKIKLGGRNGVFVNRYLWRCPLCKWIVVGGTYQSGEKLLREHTQKLHVVKDDDAVSTFNPKEKSEA